MRYSIRTLLIAATFVAIATVGVRWLWRHAPETTTSVAAGTFTMAGTLILHQLRKIWEIPGVLPTIMVALLGLFAGIVAIAYAPNPLGVFAGWGAGICLCRYGLPLLGWVLMKAGVESNVT